MHSAIPANQLTEVAGPFWVRRFLQTLSQAGYSEGRNLVIERFSAEGRIDGYAELARHVVERAPDLIVTNYNPLIRAFRTATSKIPIVAFFGDPLAAGLVTSLAQPGGNLTGVSVDAGVELYQKQLQIIKEAVPSAVTVAFLGSAPTWEGMTGQALRAVGHRLDLSLIAQTPPRPDDANLRRSFDEMVQRKAGAIVVSSEGNLLPFRELIVEFSRSAPHPGDLSLSRLRRARRVACLWRPRPR